MRISEQVASYLFAFENDFLRKFSLTWKLLCQRLYQQYVHLHLADTMLACIITVIKYNFNLIKKHYYLFLKMFLVKGRRIDFTPH